MVSPTVTLPSPSAAASRPRVSDRAALLSILGFWAFYFVLNTLRMSYGGNSLGDQLSMIGKRSVVVLVAIGLTILLWQGLRLLEGKSMRVLVCTAFFASIPVAFIYASFNYVMFYIVSPLPSAIMELDPSSEKHMAPLKIISELATTWYLFIVAWAMLYIAMWYAARAVHAERAAAEFRTQAQTAQLRALRYQVNPHFLFNTLNSLSTLVLQERTEEAEKMIMNLAKFFRTSLSGDPTEDVPLSDEIHMQRLYLDIERVRFPERLAVTLDVPEILGNVPVPGLILQPVVENAIKHGVARTAAPVTIAIRAREDKGSLHLTVEDNAKGGGSAPRGEGVGLRNVCDRLATRFSGLADCTYGPKAEGGFRVHLTIPMTA
jgi:two-component system LytT family sensor kinase